ncbi:MAG: hypothetical protein ABI772_10245 [Bacteroidota bacterium]
MKNLLAAIIIFSFFSCEKDNGSNNDIPEPTVVTLPNLINNSGFEINGIASFSNWNYTSGPIGIDTFSTDVPATGGMYSLRLEPLWLPGEGAVETYITGLTGSHQYQLNFKSKCINIINQQATASVYIKANFVAGIQSLGFGNAQWSSYTITTSLLSLTPTDTLVVKLSAGSTEVANWQVLFDNVELYQLP